MPRLSKSRILSSLQCPKRLHLEVNAPQLAQVSSATEAAFAVGHEVGAQAVELYGGDEGHFIDYSGGSLGPALRQTQELMTSLFRAPIFEATLEFDDVLVREDVLLPTSEGQNDSWRIVEVKASTKVKPEHAHDCAVQAWVHRQAGYPLQSIALAHVDNRFEYPGGGDYRGLLLENDLTEQAFELLPSVPEWVGRAREAAAGPLPEVPPGAQCTSPYECPFLAVCWPVKGEPGVDYPVSGLGGGRKKLGAWLMNGYRDIRDVPASEITNETQLRIHTVTRRGEPELLPGAKAFVDALPWPRYYLDFETASPAVPRWPGTRPYQLLPFQYSCHIEHEGGQLDHAEFLDLSGEPPMRRLAESLIAALGTQGPVLMYTPFERRVIGELASLFPDLGEDLQAIVDRLVDLAPVTKQNYYHPDMLGSWSIKAVLPTIAPDMDYAALDGIHEGNEASAAYLEAIRPETPSDRRELIGRELLTYCRHDTEAMLRLVHFFA
jgi:hypothetical protein